MRPAMLVVAALLLAGCGQPASEWPRWTEPVAEAQGPWFEPNNATILVVEVVGNVTIKGEDHDDIISFCDRVAPDAAISFWERAFRVPAPMEQEHRGQAQVLVASQIASYGLCRGGEPWSLSFDEVRLNWGAEWMSLAFDGNADGVEFGGRLLAPHDAFEHRIEWTSRDPDTGHLLTHVAQLLITSRGVWQWDAPMADPVDAYSV